MQELLSVYYQCCYQGHWNELNEVLNFKIAYPKKVKGLLCKCVKGAHQRRVSNNAVKRAVDALYNKGVLHKHYMDFEALYDDIRPIMMSISGIGNLTVYDTALRIGFIMDSIVLPRQYVYLARGAMDGAKKLLNATNLNYREPSYVFAPYFGNLSSHFVEDFLCIMKKYLTAGGVCSGIAIPPAASECGCSCSERLRNAHSKDRGSDCFVSHGCGFCKRISNENGELKDEFIEDGNKC